METTLGVRQMPVISTNIAANSAVRYLNINSEEQTASLSKLASGSRITQASDDAAGLAISTRISSDVTALTQAATNASHGVSVLQTADGGASNISDILQRMKSLASQSASGTVTDTERNYIDAEFSQLVEEIDGIASSTRYNGQSLLDGTSQFSGAGVSVIVGSNAADEITVALKTLTSDGLGLVADTAAILTGDSAADFAATVSASITVNGTAINLTDGTTTIASIATQLDAQAGTTGVNVTTNGAGALVFTSTATGATADVTVSALTAITAGDLGLTAGLTAAGADDVSVSVGTQATASTSISIIDAAIDTLSGARADIGAMESRFAFRSESIAITIENLSAANSAITDTDVAAESARLASAKVKTQAAVAAAAQANQMPQDLLRLIQG